MAALAPTLGDSLGWTSTMSHRLTILIHGHILKSAASEERPGGSCSLSFNCPSNSPWPVPELSQCSSEKTHLGKSSPLCLNLVELQHQFFSICALSFRLHNSAEVSSVLFSLFIFLISPIVIFGFFGCLFEAFTVVVL